jgi:hypothetical protein
MSARIDKGSWLCAGVEIPIHRCRARAQPTPDIAACEPSQAWVVIPGAEITEARRIAQLAGEAEWLRRRPSARAQVAELIGPVAGDDSPGAVRELSD